MFTTLNAIVIFSATSIICMGVLLIFLGQRYANHVQGLRQWGSGLLVLLASTVSAPLLLGVLGVSATQFIAHTLSLVGLMLIDDGLKRFFQEPIVYGRRLVGAFLVVILLIGLWSTFISPGSAVSYVLYLMAGVLIMLDMLWILFRHRTWGVGVLILSSALVALTTLRLFAVFVWREDWMQGEWAFDGMTAAQQTVLLLPSVLIPVATLTFVLLTVERLVQQIDQTVRHDPLTGTLNKNTLYIEMEREIERTIHNKQTLSLIRIDLSNYKTIKNEIGHKRADQLLKEVASQIRATIRVSDRLARFGSDEFAILMGDTGIEQASQIANRITQAIQTVLPDYCGANLGVVGLRSHGETPDSLLHRADQALEKAKTQGSNAVVVA